MNIEAGKEMLFLTHWPNGELVKVMILGENEFMPGSYRFKKPDGGTDFTKPDFLFDLPKNIVPRQLEIAFHQLIEFSANANYGVVDLAESMGLTSDEWEALKKEGEDCLDVKLFMYTDDIESLDNHFKEKTQ